MASLVPADSPSVWMPADFPDKSAWSFELTDQAREALIEFGRGGSDSELAREICSDAALWRDLLTVGPGFIRLRNFPVDILTQEEVVRAYLRLGALLGTPVGQDRDANLITHIRDERLPPGPGVRKYQTNLSQDFHSDASDLVGLLCLRPAKSGGMSKIVSAHAVYNEILRHDQQLVDVMCRPMPWSRTAEKHQGETPYFELTPIVFVDGIPRMSFIPWYIRQSQQYPTAPRLTEDQLAALALAERIANDPKLQIEMEFRAGDVQLLNNTTVLHAREPYTDHDDMSMRRHLIRLWVTIDNPLVNDLLPGGVAARTER